jgi:hypothetical protein
VPRALLSSIIKRQQSQQPVESEWTHWAAHVRSYRLAHSHLSALDKHSQKSHDIHGSFQLVSYNFSINLSINFYAFSSHCFTAREKSFFFSFFQLNHKRSRLEKSELIAF